MPLSGDPQADKPSQSQWGKLLAWSSVPWGTAGSLETLLPSPHWDPTSRVVSWGPQGLDNWHVLRMLSISSASSQGPVSCSPTAELSKHPHGEADCGDSRHPVRVAPEGDTVSSCSPLGPHPGPRPRSSSHVPRAGLVPVTLTLSRSTSGPWRSPAVATQRHQLEANQRAQHEISDRPN